MRARRPDGRLGWAVHVPECGALKDLVRKVLIQGRAVDRVLELADRIATAGGAARDPFSPERRFERRYPALARELGSWLRGYRQSRESALAILAFLERHFEVNGAIAAAIRAHCAGPELAEPSAELRDSYRALVREFEAAGEPLIPFPLRLPHDDFPAFLERLAASSRGEGLPEGFVPHTTCWLVSDGEVVGVSNLRHALTPALRREGGHIGYGVRPSARGRGFGREF